jgi:hypothetical protein
LVLLLGTLKLFPDIFYVGVRPTQLREDIGLLTLGLTLLRRQRAQT